MRVAADIVQGLAERIGPYDSEARRQRYRDGDFARPELVKDLDTRYRWDLYSLVRGYELTRGMNLKSAHIDTALRRIVAPLGKV